MSGAEIPVARLRAGDRDAFDSLVRQYADVLKKSAHAFLRDCCVPEARTAVDDVLQETFLAVYRGVQAGRGPANGDLQAWEKYLRHCVKNKAIDYLRRHPSSRRHRSLESRLEDNLPLGAVLPNARAEEPDVGACWEEDLRMLRECLEELDYEDRVLCVLHYVEKKALRTIAKEWGQPPSTLRDQHRSILKALKHCLKAKGWSP